MDADQVRGEIQGTLQRAGLLSVLDLRRTQFLDLPDGTYAELVLTDGGREDEIRQALADSMTGVDLSIHPVWAIETIGEPEIAYSPTGGIRTARVLAVSLRSGSVSTTVQVAVTWLAEEELKRMLGTEPPLKALVREYVEESLQWGGESYWDPRRYPQLEIASDHALSLYRSLQKTA